MNNSILGFNGQRVDSVCRAVHLGNGYRAYSPALLRFHRPDSLSPFGAGGVNGYVYCGEDPVNRTDPSGHLSWQAITGIATGVVGLALAPVTLGQSLTVTTCVMAALETASGVAAIVSGALEDSDPKASSALGWISLATGAAALGAGLGGGALRATAGIRARLGKLVSVGLSGRGAEGAGAAMTTREQLISSRISVLPQSDVYVFGVTTRENSQGGTSRELALAYRGIEDKDSHLDVFINMSLRRGRESHADINGVTWEGKRLFKRLEEIVPRMSEIKSIRVLGRGSNRLADSFFKRAGRSLVTFNDGGFWVHANNSALYRNALRPGVNVFEEAFHRGGEAEAIAVTNEFLNAELAKMSNPSARTLLIHGVADHDVLFMEYAR
ncbi:RHS repeat-associated core domain-containing protein [Chromobacterium violaceum]|uniref:RHS repeat-associated core domain-containing protein n=1 Tax=Chromobacterium violaceum TaxID=536 RepID=UPI001B2FE51B|nr:RHS repeat-associated core domain-containing protein [Chromobacterium violaceum]